MTDEEKKEMLKDIIDNGAEYEYTFLDNNGDYYPWQRYHLGDEIRSSCEYRRLELYCVTNYLHKKDVVQRLSVFANPNDDVIKYKGTKEECEKWLEEHQPKIWLDNFLNDNSDGPAKRALIKLGAKETAKKILEEAEKYLTSNYLSVMKNIVKDIGIEI